MLCDEALQTERTRVMVVRRAGEFKGFVHFINENSKLFRDSVLALFDDTRLSGVSLRWQKKWKVD
jgi:hypothetical protein